MIQQTSQPSIVVSSFAFIIAAIVLIVVAYLVFRKGKDMSDASSEWLDTN